MGIFDPNIFEPNIFVNLVSSSTTESSVVERKRSKGRTRPFIKATTRKFRKVFMSYESAKSVPVRSFKPAPVMESVRVRSIRMQDLDADGLLAEAKELVFEAASKSVDIKTVKKTWQSVSMKPKRTRRTLDAHTYMTQARELIASAQHLLEKPSVPELEPTLYGYAPIYEYGEVEFEIDKRVHNEPDECDDYDGQVFSYGPDGLEDGAPVPPLHPNCGCVLRETKTRQIMYFPGSEWDTG